MRNHDNFLPLETRSFNSCQKCICMPGQTLLSPIRSQRRGEKAMTTLFKFVCQKLIAFRALATAMHKKEGGHWYSPQGTHTVEPFGSGHWISDIVFLGCSWRQPPEMSELPVTRASPTQRLWQRSNSLESFVSGRERVEAKAAQNLPNLLSQATSDHAYDRIRRVG